MDDIKSEDYTPAELRMLLRAVRRVLTSDRNVVKNNAALRDTAIHIGLIEV